MVAKIKGRNPALNSNAVAQWRDGTPTGDTTKLDNNIGFGDSWREIDFNQVMFQSIGNTQANFGWEFPTSLNGMATARACIMVSNVCSRSVGGEERRITDIVAQVDNAKVIFGDVTILQHPNQGHWEYNPCHANDRMRYGE